MFVLCWHRQTKSLSRLAAILVLVSVLVKAATDSDKQVPVSSDASRHRDAREGVMVIGAQRPGIEETEEARRSLSALNHTFVAYLTERMGAQFNVSFQMVELSAEELYRAAGDGALDLVYSTPSLYTCMQHGYGLSPVATAYRHVRRGNTTFLLDRYRGAIVVRANSTIHDVGDVRNSVLEAVAPISTGGYTLQMSEMMAQGISPMTELKQLRFAMDHVAVVADVLAGHADVGMVRAGVVEGLVQRGVFGEGEARVLRNRQGTLSGDEPTDPQGTAEYPFNHSTAADTPEWPLGAFPWVSKELAAEIATALYGVEPSESLGLAWTTPSSYLDIDQVDRSVRHWSQAEDDADQHEYCEMRDVCAAVRCPPNTIKKSCAQIESGCEEAGMACPEGYWCLCSPCLDLSVRGQEELVVTPVRRYETGTTAVVLFENTTTCKKMLRCASVEVDDSVVLHVVDAWFETRRLTGEAFVEAVQFRVREDINGQPEWLNATEADVQDGHAREFHITFSVARPGFLLLQIRACASGECQSVAESPFVFEVLERACPGAHMTRTEDGSICVCVAGYEFAGEGMCTPSNTDGGELVDWKLVVGLLAAGLAILGALACIFRSYRRREATPWRITLNQLVFEDPPVVLGRGTYGQVLKAEYRGTEVAVKRVLPRLVGRAPGSRVRQSLCGMPMFGDMDARLAPGAATQQSKKEMFEQTSEESHVAPRASSLPLPLEVGNARSPEGSVRHRPSFDHVEAASIGRRRSAESECSALALEGGTVEFQTRNASSGSHESNLNGTTSRLRSQTTLRSSLVSKTRMDMVVVDNPKANEMQLRIQDSEASSSLKGSGAGQGPAFFDGVWRSVRGMDALSDSFENRAPRGGHWRSNTFERLFGKASRLDPICSFADDIVIEMDRPAPVRAETLDDKALRRLRAQFMQEMQVLTNLRHPNIITVMGAVVEKNAECLIVLENMKNGSLYDLLQNHTMQLDCEIVMNILEDLVSGMLYLHSTHPPVLHNDLKTGNVLVGNNFSVKISDFGLSMKKRASGLIGTPFWTAPEILQTGAQPSIKSDVYSFGITMFEIFTQREPYDEYEDPQQVLLRLTNPQEDPPIRPTIPEEFPESVTQLMQKCWSADPDDRPTFDEIRSMLRALDKDQIENWFQGEEALGRFSRAGASIHQKRTSTQLLHDVFPPHIARTLQQGRKVDPEQHDCVTIFFSDIVGFTDISRTLQPLQVMNMLDRLYFQFDEIALKHQVFKVETIGDAYMAVSNLVKKQDDHTKRVAEFSLELIQAANKTLVNQEQPELGFVNIRVGFHVGAVVASVVGNTNPRFCLFGDAVNTASRMESNSVANCAHMSEAAAKKLALQAPLMALERRGKIQIKGKGQMVTYWLADACPAEMSALRSAPSKSHESHLAPATSGGLEHAANARQSYEEVMSAHSGDSGDVDRRSNQRLAGNQRSNCLANENERATAHAVRSPRKTRISNDFIPRLISALPSMKRPNSLF